MPAKSEHLPPSTDEGFLARGGQMGALMRSHNWSETSLGPIHSWPQSLRTSVSICLNSRFPMILWWGPELTVLYNDPYIPILGAKHPDRALGLPGAEVWSEVWPVIEPLLMRVLLHGEANWADDLQLFINRSGYAEECYFRFSYSPISNESGGIGGVFTPVSETTQKVVAERRLLTLRELADCGNRSQSALQACQSMAAVISQNSYDLPFTAFYLVKDKAARLVATAGVNEGTSLSPLTLSLHAHADSPIARAAASASTQIISDLTAFEPLPTGPWGDPPSAIVVQPVSMPGQTESAAILVAGVSARKHLDADYRSFFELIAQQIGTAVSAAHSYDEERRRAEALAELDRAKTTFFSNVSHEFRTPLTLMMGPLDEILTHTPNLSPDLTAQISMIRRNALRLHKMVNTLLDFSRMEAGRLKASCQPTELCSFITDLSSTFRSVIESAGLEFVVDCQLLSQSVWIDCEMWEKLFLNLLSNAFKYTFKGRITVRLKEDADGASLSVTDTGSGIPSHELPHIFERFHRVDGAWGRTQEGTGIGLAIVHEIVTRHGGRISVNSVPDIGTEFTIFLPFGSAHLPPESLSQSARPHVRHDQAFVEEASRWLPAAAVQPIPATDFQSAVHQAPLAENHLLLVDDNADMRQYLQRLLSPFYQVETAANGKQALQLALSHPPDIVLSDIMMPELDGVGLLNALRRNQSTSSIPVILLSARAGEESLSEGMAAGADDYLLKPFSSSELLARIGAHLKISKFRRQAELNEAQLRLQAESSRDLATSILESITDGFFTLDSNWCFTYVNKAAERILDYTREYLVGKNHWEVYPAALGTICETEYKRAVRDQVPVDFEVCYQPDQRWFSVRSNPTKAGGLSVYFRDITKGKRAAEELLESEKRFRQLADNISQLAWMGDATGALFWYNQRWYDYTGTTIEQMRGWGWQSVHHPDHVARVLDRFKACVAAGEPWDDTFPLRGRHGEWRWYLSRARPIHDDNGRIVRWFGTNTDITAQLDTERDLRRANLDLEQFAFSASHDLKEPLRSVSIYSQLLQRKLKASLDPQSQQFLGYIIDGAERMDNLISDLLAYTQAGILDETPIEPVDSQSVFNEVVAGFSLSVAQDGACITSGPLPVVAVKAVHLQQLFQNLIGNALKYHKDDIAATVHVEASQSHAFWQFSVKDNGIGIAPEFHDKVFGIFKRLHAKTGKYPGTGIGLAICQRIVERYGGRTWLESAAGQGSTFYFTLPAAHLADHSVGQSAGHSA